MCLVREAPLLSHLTCKPDFGFVIAAFVPLVLLWIFGEGHLEPVWRLSLGLGVVPAVAVFIWRLSKWETYGMPSCLTRIAGMENPESYKRHSMKHARVPYLLIFKRYWGRLFAISAAWFLYDIIAFVASVLASSFHSLLMFQLSLWNFLVYSRR